MNDMKQSIQTFEKAIDNMIAFLLEKEEKNLFIQPSEKEWSVMQIAAHVIEAIPFWLDDVQSLLIVPHGKWGRNHEHAGRLAAVQPEVVNELKVDEIIEHLRELISPVVTTLNQITEADLEIVAPSYNPNFENKSLQFIIDVLIVNHAAGHYDQMVRHYDKVTN